MKTQSEKWHKKKKQEKVIFYVISMANDNS